MSDQAPDNKDFGNWITGFTDGEGFFSATWRKDQRLSVCFGIHLRVDDHEILASIQEYFQGVGGISFRSARKNSAPSCEFKISSVSHLVDIVIPHFEAHPLRSKKSRDFEIWKELVILEAERRANKQAGTEWNKQDQIIPLVERLQGVKRYNHYKTFYGMSSKALKDD